MNKRYYFRAKAYKVGDTSGWSSENYFNTDVKMANVAPTNGSVDILMRNINVRGSQGQYTIFEIDTTSTFSSPLFQRVFRNVYYFIDSTIMDYGGKFYYRATAYNPWGDTLAWSDAWSFTVRKKPTITAGIQNNVNPKAVVSWNAPGVSHIRVMRDTTPTFSSPDLLVYNAGQLFRDTFYDMHFGKKYYWKIQEHFNGKNSLWSDSGIYTIKAGTTLSSPGHLATGVALFSNFGWQAISGCNYQFQLMADSASGLVIKDTITSNNIYSPVKGLLRINRMYYWRVRVMHSKDTSAWTLIRAFTTVTGSVTPNYPASNATNIPVALRLTWYSDPSADGYILELDTSLTFSSSKFIRRILGKVTSDTVYDLYYGSNYYFRITYFASGDTGVFGATYYRKFTTANKANPNYPPNSPTFNIGTSVNGLVSNIFGSLWVEWQLDTNPQFNSPEFKSKVTPRVPDIFDPNLSDFHMADSLLYHAVYYWRTRYLNRADTSDWTNTWAFATVKDVWTDSPSVNAVNQPVLTKLKWRTYGSYDEHVYQYQIGTDSNFVSKPIFTLPAGSLAEKIVTGTYSTKYYWRARACHSRDTSKWSNIAYFTTLARPTLSIPVLASPPNGSLNVPYSISATLQWYPVSNADFYNVEATRDPNFQIDVVRASPSLNGVYFSSLQPSTRYYWRVQAAKDTFTSNWSAPFWFQTESATGITDKASTHDLTVFPNPFKDYLRIDFNTSSGNIFAVFNLQGQLILEGKASSTEGIKMFDTSQWPSGIYLIKVMDTTGKNFYTKLLKE